MDYSCFVFKVHCYIAFHCFLTELHDFQISGRFGQNLKIILCSFVHVFIGYLHTLSGYFSSGSVIERVIYPAN